MRLGTGLGITRVRGIGLPQIITSLISTSQPLTEGDLLSSLPASLTDTASYESSEGNITSAVLQVNGVTQPGSYALAPGDVVRVLVSDDAGTTPRPFSVGRAAYIAPTAAGGLPDISLFVGDDINVDLSGDFTGNDLTHSLAPSSASLSDVGLELSESGQLTGEAIAALPTSVIVIRATNPDGAFVDSAFNIDVTLRTQVANAVDYEVTIDPANIVSDLTDFPVQVRLSGVPQAFWDGINYQAGNVRAFVGGNEVPFAATRIMKEAQEGEVSALLPAVSSSAETTFVLRVYNDKDRAPRAYEDPLGAGSVYASRYAAVVLGGHAMRNYGSVGGPVLAVGDATFFSRTGVQQTFAQPTHQGVAKDHLTGWTFGIDTDRIQAFDETGALQWTNSNPSDDLQTFAGAGPEFDHLCDGTVFGNWLIIPINSYNGTFPTSGAYIAVFDVSDGSYVTATQITGSPEISGICWNPEINRLVAVTFGIPLTQLETYTLNKNSGEIVLDGAIPVTASQTISGIALPENIQGIEYAWGGYYISHDSIDRRSIMRMEAAPTGVTYDPSCYVAVEVFGNGNAEGLTRDGDGLSWLIDPSDADSYTVKFEPGAIESAGGAMYNPLNVSSGFSVHGLNITNSDDWTLSAVGRPETNRQSMLATMRQDGATGDVREGIVFRGGNRVDTWRSGGSWIEPPVVQTWSATGDEAFRERHPALIQTTTSRRFLVDGVEVDIEDPRNAMSDILDVLEIGREDLTNNEEFHGLIGAVKLALSDLGNDFLNAEHLMLHEADFTTVVVSDAPVVDPDNYAPVAVDDDGLTTAFETPIAVRVLDNDTDLDGGTLRLQSVSDPLGGTVVVTDAEAGIATFTPAADFSGTALFNYEVTDGTDTDTGTVSITVAEEVIIVPVVTSISAGTVSGNSLPLTIDVEDGTPDVEVAVGDFDVVGDGSTLLNRNLATGGENVVTTPIAADAGWGGAHGGTVLQDLSLNAFGLFPGLRVTTDGASWAGGQVSMNVDDGVTYFGFVGYRVVETVNPKARITLRTPSGTETRLVGPVGSLAPTGDQPEDQPAGPATILAQENVGDDHVILFSYTPNETGAGVIRIGPDDGSAQIIILGANMVDAVEPTSFITGAGVAEARPDAIASDTFLAVSDGIQTLDLPTGLDASYRVLATTPDNTAIVSDGPFPLDTSVAAPDANSLTLNSASLTALPGGGLRIDMDAGYDGDGTVRIHLAPTTNDTVPTQSQMDAASGNVIEKRDFLFTSDNQEVTVSFTTAPVEGDDIAIQLREVGTDVVTAILMLEVPAPIAISGITVAAIPASPVVEEAAASPAVWQFNRAASGPGIIMFGGFRFQGSQSAHLINGVTYGGVAASSFEVVLSPLEPRLYIGVAGFANMASGLRNLEVLQTSGDAMQNFHGAQLFETSAIPANLNALETTSLAGVGTMSLNLGALAAGGGVVAAGISQNTPAGATLTGVSKAGEVQLGSNNFSTAFLSDLSAAQDPFTATLTLDNAAGSSSGLFVALPINPA